MLITFFIILLTAATVLLISGIKMKHWLLCAVATILFLTLAFQAFKIEVPTGGTTIVFEEIVIVLLCWGATGISLIFTLLGMVSHLKSRSKTTQQVRRPYS